MRCVAFSLLFAALGAAPAGAQQLAPPPPLPPGVGIYPPPPPAPVGPSTGHWNWYGVPALAFDPYAPRLLAPPPPVAAPAPPPVAVFQPQAVRYTRAMLVEGRTAADALLLYDAGVSEFWAGRLMQAKQYLEASIVLFGADARSWSYLAVVNWSLGDPTLAREAADYAAAVVRTDAEQFGPLMAAVERLPGAVRLALDDANGRVPTVSAARAVLSRKPSFLSDTPAK